MLDALDDEPIFIRNLIKGRLRNVMNARNAPAPVRAPHYSQPANSATASNRRAQPGLSTQEMLTLLAAFAAPELCEV